MRRFLFLFVLCLLPLAAFADYERINEPNPDDPMDVHIYRLDNGLTVYLTRNPEEPRFYAEIATRAGSKHDPAESTGLAHYLEHVLFKGTKKLGTLDYEKEREYIDRIEELYEQHFNETDEAKRKELFAAINEATVAGSEYAIPNEMDRVYKAMGGQAVNAHTWHEETVYKVDLPSNRLTQWAIMETERFTDPVFRLFQPELEVVYEEMNRALDNKQRIIMYAVEETLYKKHPYGQQNTLGTVEHLKNPSLANIREYFDTYYVPNHMSIFISGDIDIESAIEIIDEHFSAWEAKEVPEKEFPEEPPIDGREYVEKTYEGEEFCLLAFRTVPVKHEDQEALMLLDMIMDNATAGLINLNLNQQQRVRQAGSYPQFNNDYGAQYFYGIPKDGQTLEEVEALLLEQLDLVKNGEFDDCILPAIINDFKKREKGGLENNTARVSAMRDSWIHYIEWEDAVSQIERLEQVTKEDVVRVANEYFGENYVVGYRKDAPHEVPDIEKPELATIEIDPTRESPFARELMAMEVEPIEPVFVEPGVDYMKEVDEKGRTFYYAPNPLNDIFTFTIGVEFGKHEDNTIGTAIALLDKSGTAEFSPEELKKEWYKLGTDFGISAGDNETTITISGLDEQFEASLELLLSLLRDPRADEETLTQLKAIILKGREDARKEASSIADALVRYHRYGDDSPYLRRLSSDELNALTVEQLAGAITQLLDYKHTVSYVGSLPMKKVKKILKRHKPVKEELKDTPPYRYLTAREVEADQIYFHDKETAQATVRLEFGSVDVDEALMPEIMLFNSYFSGGMAGLVFQELREARALAYSAGARYITGYRKGDENLMVGVIQTQADKTVDATNAFIELMDAMPESEQRFAFARESLIQQYRTGKIGFRGVIGAVRAWERLGLEPDPRKARFEAIQSADMSGMMEFQTEYVADKPKLISIVGDAEKIGLEGLNEIAPVETIDLDTIFVK